MNRPLPLKVAAFLHIGENMQICNCSVAIGGDVGMTVTKERVTIPELMILRAVHGDDAVRNIEVTHSVSMSNTEERERLIQIYRNPEFVVRDTVGATGTLPTEIEDSGIPEDFIIGNLTTHSGVAKKRRKSAAQPLEVESDEQVSNE
jgi:hypothetical protein